MNGSSAGPGATSGLRRLWRSFAAAGAFPLEVAADARRAGRTPFLIGVVGASEAGIEAYPHVWVRMGEVGKLFAALKERAIGEMVIVGAMTRPEFADLRLDWGAVKRAAELAQLFRGGDNGLLDGLAAIFEREGVRIVGAHEVAPRLVAPVGRLGARPVSPDDEADIAFGARSSRGAVALRRGAGRRGRAPGGCSPSKRPRVQTRCSPAWRTCAPSGRLRLKGPAGVLVKAPKRGQDLRLDMPAIGPATIDGALKAGLRGVAIAAGSVLVVERERCTREADAAGTVFRRLPVVSDSRLRGSCESGSSPANIRAINSASS